MIQSLNFISGYILVLQSETVRLCDYKPQKLHVHKKSASYAQSSTIVSIDVSADMQLVQSSLVVNVEAPVFGREPVVGRVRLPFQAQSVVARRRQKVNSLQTQPEVLCVDVTEPVSVVVPSLVPVKPARYIAMHHHDPAGDESHWD